MKITNDAGNALTINRYDEFGIPQVGNAGRFQYTGQAWLASLGMYYYKARMYSPTLGRFMQTDPIGYGDGMNWYNYVGSDPVNKTDPTGMQQDGSGYATKSGDLCDLSNPAPPAGCPNAEVTVMGRRKDPFADWGPPDVFGPSWANADAASPVEWSQNGVGFQLASLSFFDKTVARAAYSASANLRNNIKSAFQRVAGRPFTDEQIKSILGDVLNGRSTTLDGLKLFANFNPSVSKFNPSQINVINTYVSELPNTALNNSVRFGWQSYLESIGKSR